MAKLTRSKGSTQVILEVFIQDSSSATGAGLTGLAWNSSGLNCYYHRNTQGSPVVVTLANMSAGNYESGGFCQIDSSNMPGMYQLCLPDAAYDDGCESLTVVLKGATNMLPAYFEIDMVTEWDRDYTLHATSRTFGALLLDLVNYLEDPYLLNENIWDEIIIASNCSDVESVTARMLVARMYKLAGASTYLMNGNQQIYRDICDTNDDITRQVNYTGTSSEILNITTTFDD